MSPEPLSETVHASPPAVTGSSLPPRTILVVEDERIVARDIQQRLGALGYTVPATAASGEDAVKRARELSPDLVLMDVRMPGKLDGIEAGRIIRTEMDIPVVYLTAFSDAATFERAQTSDSFGFVLKPLREFELRSAIEIALSRHARESGLRKPGLLVNAELERRVVERTARLEAARQLPEAVTAIDADDYSRRVRAASRQMATLLDDMEGLARASKRLPEDATLDLSSLAREIGAELAAQHADRTVELVVRDGASTNSDPDLIRSVLEHLLDNAWKFTAHRAAARIEVGFTDVGGQRTFFVRDNGAGFDMACADGLFGAFQRLHPPHEFEGTGLGLTTVQRLVKRHGGQVWAHGDVGLGATFYFTLPSRL